MSEFDEHKIQSEFVAKARLLYPEYVIAAVPNRAAGFKGASYYTQEGMLKGMSDIVVAAKRKKYGGLYLEFKRPGGKRNGKYISKGVLSPEQKKVCKMLQRGGQCVKVVYSCDQALRVLCKYMNKGTSKKKKGEVIYL